MATWRVNDVVVVLNTEDVVPIHDTTGSWYCINTALTTMHDLVQRLRYTNGNHILAITPYNAQVRLLLALRDDATEKALQSGNRKIAKELTKVMILTVDSSMGKDRHVVVLDSVGCDQGFFWRQPRTLVAGTRTRTCFVFIGPTYLYTSTKKIAMDNRLKDMLYEWGQARVIVPIQRHERDTFEQYHDVQVALGLVSLDATPKILTDLRLAPLAAALTPEEYSEVEEDGVFNEQIQQHLDMIREQHQQLLSASGVGRSVPPHLRRRFGQRLKQE
ncbi:hypothetical protein J1614_012258 [Plenodomus biglobosus]|nr:hypothetical protein J1614_012258 [Plenodomus biglobosus]